MRSKLSNDPAALILGIVALVLSLVGCCSVILSILAIVLGITGLVLAVKSIKEFDQYPDVFTTGSRSNMNTGKIMSIIALSISGLKLLLLLIGLIVMGSSVDLSNLKEIIEESRQKNRELQEMTYPEIDSLEVQEIESDTAYYDTLEIKHTN